MADGDRIIIGQANTASKPGNETSLSRNEGTASTVFVARNVNLGDGIHGEASGGIGVGGTSTSSTGVSGRTSSAFAGGVSGFSSGGWGVYGSSSSGLGMWGNSTRGSGVMGTSGSRYGVLGTSTSSTGVRGVGRDSGVEGVTSPGRIGSIGVYGSSPTGPFSAGVWGDAPENIGVGGISTSGVGVYGDRRNPYDGTALFGVAGLFNGGIKVINGPKNFQIDHPLDPENKYLVHTCVESSEMKNVYDGVAQLDEDGEASVELPEWFEALNGDFRYQLTAVGRSAPGLHVAEEVSENRFKIAGGEEGLKVCWQVTGSRKDPWAAANTFEVEQDKPEEEQGRYLDPSLYDAPEEQRVMMGPLVEAVEAEQRPPEPSGLDPARLEEEHRRLIDEWRRLEEEHRREMEELRRRMEEQQEEPPPEST